MLYLRELENKTPYNTKKGRKPWKGLYWAAEQWDLFPVTSDPEEDLILETCKISCEVSNLGYILLVHLSVFFFFFFLWEDIPALIWEW